jgi:hypothetical protein
MNKRTDVINFLINKYQYNSYLEIGVRNPEDNFNSINCAVKHGVDPEGKCEYVMTSDDFFSTNENIYDIIFIDGLHLEEQVQKDILNSLKFLNKNGTIVIHDCSPVKEEHQSEIYNNGTWNGTTWKAWANFRMEREDLKMFVVNVDHGCGIIRRGKQEVFPFEHNLDFNFLNSNRKKLLNLKEVSDLNVVLEDE